MYAYAPAVVSSFALRKRRAKRKEPRRGMKKEERKENGDNGGVSERLPTSRFTLRMMHRSVVDFRQRYDGIAVMDSK